MPNSHIDIAVASISCFTDDGTLSRGEVEHLVGLALRDGDVNDEEKRVLKSIFQRVTQGEVSEETWTLMQNTRSKYGF